MTRPYDYDLYAEMNRNRVYDKVIEAIEKAALEQGITKTQIAQATGRKLPQISAWLSGPSNWTLDTTSDLLRSIHATMDYAVVFDTDRTKSNIVHPANLAPDFSLAPTEATPIAGSANAACPIAVTGTTSSSIPASGIGGSSLWLTLPHPNLSLDLSKSRE